jgi:SPP1 family predicted phage head-tail adaptor
MRHRVTIQRPVADPAWGGTTTWQDHATVWAAIEPLSGREFFAAQQVQSETTGKITIRYIPGITADMRILHGSRIFELTAPPIDPQERHAELQLMVKETTP